MSSSEQGNWIGISVDELPDNLVNRDISSLTFNESEDTNKETLEWVFMIYLSSKWPYVSKEQSNDISNSFRGQLIKTLSDQGINEIKEIRNLISKKRTELKKDLEKLPTEVSFDINWEERLQPIKDLLRRKERMINDFLTVYTIKGEVENTDLMGFFSFISPEIKNDISIVSEAISSHGKGKYKSITIKTFLKAYYVFKDTNVGLMKVKELVLEKVQNETVHAELGSISNSVLDHWKTKLNDRLSE